MKKKALSAFYENLAHGQHDVDYYLSPIGISRRAEILALIQGACTELIGDFGCGDGLIASKLRRDNRKVVGCDLSHTRTRRAKTIGIEVACADVMQLPFADTAFDWVICSEVIEHVIDPRNVLAEIYRVLRPGGSAVLTVPLGEQLGCTLLDVPEDQLAVESYQKIKEQFQVKGSHLTSFSEASFQAMVVSCGFKNDVARYTHHYSLRYPLLWRVVKKIVSVMDDRLPLKKYPEILEAVMRPFIWASYRQEKTAHHIVLRAVKEDV